MDNAEKTGPGRKPGTIMVDDKCEVKCVSMPGSVIENIEAEAKTLDISFSKAVSDRCAKQKYIPDGQGR